MYEEYDKSLHAPWQYRTMESPAQELDEEKLDAAIADLLGEQAAEDKAEPSQRLEFPDLKSQKEVSAQADAKEAGLSASLRQKWAELSGAA